MIFFKIYLKLSLMLLKIKFLLMLITYSIIYYMRLKKEIIEDLCENLQLTKDQKKILYLKYGINEDELNI